MIESIYDSEKNIHHCPLCGITHKTAFKHNCRKEKPSLAKKAFNFTVALAEHVADGGKKRTKEEIEGLLKICEACPFYKKSKEGLGECTECGCSISRSRKFFNKLAWLSQHCPKNYW